MNGDAGETRPNGGSGKQVVAALFWRRPHACREVRCSGTRPVGTLWPRDSTSWLGTDWGFSELADGVRYWWGTAHGVGHVVISNASSVVYEGSIPLPPAWTSGLAKDAEGEALDIENNTLTGITVAAGKSLTYEFRK
ncbi:MAG: hypothetical protein HOJ57_39720 [Lentisphaerae bacterium]|jgi:hypothetical protein|nr:hypothetical protein [Lentisphaerota bacterium]MBT4817806.1 hypothetical protein [Lentisphaerota bacterium]MBT5612133.1 hypothetical protein [Lentisphaerota bacterium]MBT7058768.1 hypothetical protein [Lentisphaerota bacterium]